MLGMRCKTRKKLSFCIYYLVYNVLYLSICKYTIFFLRKVKEEWDKYFIEYETGGDAYPTKNQEYFYKLLIFI